MHRNLRLPRALRIGALSLAVFAAGCSTKLYTHARMPLPARPEGTPVLVYAPTDSLPAPGDLLGTVGVKDSGFSTGCTYAQVVRQAENAVNSLGGNTLQLTRHQLPKTFGSSCHQIEGNVLLLPDSVYRNAYVANAAIQRGRETLYDGAAAKDVPTAPELLPPSADETTLAGARSAAKVADEAVAAKGPNKADFTLLLDAGYGIMTSEYLVPGNSSGNPKRGLDAGVTLRWIWRPGLGLGIRYAGYYSSVTLHSHWQTSDGQFRKKEDKYLIRLHYVAPEFVLRQKAGDKWLFSEAFGVGYVRYSEVLDNYSTGIGGVGFHMNLGVEYKLSQHVGLGASFGVYNARFSAMDKIAEKVDKDAKGGITRVNVNGGLRFYF